jgi:5-amino-6-(5-phospho-D-ribitylamino)uracil phosphatase
MKTTKLVAIDIDGTLINDRLALGSFTKEYLRYIQAHGWIVVLATGRPWRSAKPYYEALGCRGPLICYNGAHVFSPGDSSFKEFRKTFPQIEVRAISRGLQGKITSAMCESETDVYLSREDEYLSHYFPYKGMEKRIGPIESILDIDPFTVIFRSAHKYDADIEKEVEKYPSFLYRHWTHSFYSEASLEGVDKGSALRYALAQLGFKREDAIAFGDSENDYEMLREAGQGFAMRDAKCRQLLKEFPQTEKSNNQDGVALTLKRLLS